MCVNDCVSINGRWYQCKGTGWKQTATYEVDNLGDEVRAHPFFRLYGAFFCLDDIMWQRHLASQAK